MSNYVGHTSIGREISTKIKNKMNNKAQKNMNDSVFFTNSSFKIKRMQMHNLLINTSENDEIWI
jgi:hypothetical protein